MRSSSLYLASPTATTVFPDFRTRSGRMLRAGTTIPSDETPGAVRRRRACVSSVYAVLLLVDDALQEPLEKLVHVDREGRSDDLAIFVSN